MKGRKRHVLVDTEGIVLKAKVHSAKVMDYEGIKTLLHRAKERFPRLRHLWLEAGYRGEDKGAEDWVRKTLGWTVEMVERPKKPTPEEVLIPPACGRAEGVGEGNVFSMGEEVLHGLWVPLHELVARSLELFEYFVEIVYGSHSDITSIVEALSFP